MKHSLPGSCLLELYLEYLVREFGAKEYQLVEIHEQDDRITIWNLHLGTDRDV